MKVISESTRSVRSMNSGSMQVRIVSSEGLFFTEYYVVATSEWKRMGVYKSIPECELRMNKFIEMHNRIVGE